MSGWRLLVLIPSYNTGGPLLEATVRPVLEGGHDTLVVVDGSTDGSDAVLDPLAAEHRKLRIIRKARNAGKGEAIRTGAMAARAAGFTHVLSMDSDGQHPLAAIDKLAAMSRDHPADLVMGQPVFGEDAPLTRVLGRRLTTVWTDLETLWCGLGDTLFGMRVYPVDALLKAFSQTPFARGFDFDPEIAVRMAWLDCRPRQVPVRVTYLEKEAGGISHFDYFRDNLKLTLLHFRLVPEFLLLRIIPFLSHSRKWKSPS